MMTQETIQLVTQEEIRDRIKSELQYAEHGEQPSASEVIAAACEAACKVLKERLQKASAGRQTDFCVGCINEHDLSCYCHGGRGYIPREQQSQQGLA